MMTDRKLTNNFSLSEFLYSKTAQRQANLEKKQNNPPADVVANLEYLAKTTVQPMREGIGFALRISSGYRCPEVNKLVGGSNTSQHVFGQAADVILSAQFLTDAAAANVRQQIEADVLRVTRKPVRKNLSANFYLFAYVCLRLDQLDIDQVIHEYGTGFGNPAWVHVVSSSTQNKRQIVVIGNYGKGVVDLKTALSYGV